MTTDEQTDDSSRKWVVVDIVGNPIVYGLYKSEEAAVKAAHNHDDKVHDGIEYGFGVFAVELSDA